MEDPTRYPQIDPTKPARPGSYDPYTPNTGAPDIDASTFIRPIYTNPYSDFAPPPPPVSPKQKRAFPVLPVSLGLAALVMLVLASGLFYMARSFQANKDQPTPIVEVVTAIPSHAAQPTTAPTAKVSPDYQANDIAADLEQVDSSINIYSQNDTIWDFSRDLFFISDHAQSSIQFTGCPSGNCPSVQYYGLWVYGTQQEAMASYKQALQDSNNCTASNAAAGEMDNVLCDGQEQAATAGRCLLLNANSYSPYGTVITRDCI